MSNNEYKISFSDSQKELKNGKDLLCGMIKHSKDTPFNQTQKCFCELAEISKRAVLPIQLFALVLELGRVRFLYNQYSCPTRKKYRRRIKNLKRKIKKIKIKRGM